MWNSEYNLCLFASITRQRENNTKKCKWTLASCRISFDSRNESVLDIVCTFVDQALFESRTISFRGHFTFHLSEDSSALVKITRDLCSISFSHFISRTIHRPSWSSTSVRSAIRYFIFVPSWYTILKRNSREIKVFDNYLASNLPRDDRTWWKVLIKATTLTGLVQL